MDQLLTQDGHLEELVVIVTVRSSYQSYKDDDFLKT